MESNPLSSMSFSEAVREFGLPIENKQFLTMLEGSIPSVGCEVLTSYIKYFRADSLPHLEIHFGYTTGFQSEKEILQIFGDVERWESKRVKNAWGVSHPLNKIRESGYPQKQNSHRSKFCSICGMQLSQTGLCEFCS